jgi:cytidylate kinase
MKPEDLVITVAGPHGSGRTTQAKLIAHQFGLRYVSAGTIFRQRANELGLSLEEMTLRASESSDFDNYLDRKSKEESKRGGVVIDASLSAWMAEDPDLKIYLTCPLEERVKRIASREGRALSEVEKETKYREEKERKRFMDYYGIDIEDLSIYDLVINTKLLNEHGISRILKAFIGEYLNKGE